MIAPAGSLTVGVVANAVVSLTSAGDESGPLSVALRQINRAARPTIKSGTMMKTHSGGRKPSSSGISLGGRLPGGGRGWEPVEGGVAGAGPGEGGLAGAAPPPPAGAGPGGRGGGRGLPVPDR